MFVAAKHTIGTGSPTLIFSGKGKLILTNSSGSFVIGGSGVTGADGYPVTSTMSFDFYEDVDVYAIGQSSSVAFSVSYPLGNPVLRVDC